MNPLLARLPHKRVNALFVVERRLFLSRLALTPLGVVEVGLHVEEMGREPLEAALRRAVEAIPPGKTWRSAPMVVGLPTLSVFFSTRPIKSMNRDASAQVLLHEVLQSSSLNIDDMEVDMVPLQPGKQPLASIVACRKRQLGPILATLESCGIRPQQIEPAPCALLRAAVARHRTPRKVRTAIRIFLGERTGLAVLTAADAPLLWRSFDLPAGAEADAIVSAFRTIETLAQPCGADEALRTAIVHGRPELAGVAESAGWSGTPPVQVVRHDGPGYSSAEIARGLALSCRQPGVAGFNLGRSRLPPPPVLGLIPWGQLLLQGGLLAGATLFVFGQQQALDRRERQVRDDLTRFAWLKDRKAADLEAERRELDTRSEAIRAYLDGRILWTNYAAEVAARLPEDMAVSSIDARAETPSGPVKSGNKPKNRLALAIEAPIPKSGAIPPEIDGLLDALRKSPVFRESLPSVEMASLRWNASGQGAAPRAAFSVICQPKVDAPPKPRK